jgi:hypothetical protein
MEVFNSLKDFKTDSGKPLSYFYLLPLIAKVYVTEEEQGWYIGWFCWLIFISTAKRVTNK